MAENYLPRLSDNIIAKKLKKSGAVLIEGSKWSGKTRTAEEFCKSAFYIQGEPKIKALTAAIESGSMTFLQGDTPRLIDEWQDVPSTWDLIRFEVDHRHEPGQFILTESSVPHIDSTQHSGVGRIASVTQRTMSLFESGESNGKTSLKGLFEGDGVDASTGLTMDGIVHAIVRGGWPEAVATYSENNSNPGEYASECLESIHQDVSRLLYAGIDDPSACRRNRRNTPRDETVAMITRGLMASISRNLATSTSFNTIKNDVNAGSELASSPTLTKYKGALERLFILENLTAWNTHVRSSASLKVASKWHFTDPSLAVAALNLGVQNLMNDYNALGFFFESMCLRDLRVYVASLGGEVHHLRVNENYEVDFIVTLRDGRWGAVEVKFGSFDYDRAAENLLNIGRYVDLEKVGESSFRAILTGMPLGYTRKDGVHVVPVGCLRD